MSKAPVAVIHTVGSLTPNSGVTPVISNSLGFRQAAGQQARCLAFSDHYDAQRWQGLTGTLRLIERPRLPWQQYARFRDALIDEVMKQRQLGHRVVLHDHGMWLPSNLAASAVARTLNCPIIVSPHGMLQPAAVDYRGTKKKLAWLLMERRRMRAATKVMVTSAIEEQAVKQLLPDACTVTVPLGFDVPAQSEAHQPKEKTVLYLGRVHVLKGIEVMLRAWPQARQDGWRLRIVGPTETTYRRHLLNLVTDLGIEDSVTLEGPIYRNEKLRVWHTSALFVLASYTENFGMVVCEALGHGLPVLTTDKTPWTDIPERECGWICSPTVPDVAHALRRAMSTPMPTLQAMGEAGWSWMKSSFDLPVVARQMNDCYEELRHA